MAERDYESKGDEIERDNLQKAISEVETALAGSTPGTRPFFETFLVNARGRVGTLDKKLKDSEKDRESRTRDQVVIAQMAEQEKALSSEERKTFSGFLGKDFFTKKDFGSLEKFYANSWDRLSENGKDQMSKRIWEGIRRDEYTFGELPKVVQEKEADRAYSVLKKRESEAVKTFNIPQADRDDFIRAYESGDRDKARQVLERDSFKQNMFLVPESAAKVSKPVERGSVVSKAEVEAKLEATARALGEPSKNGEYNTARKLPELALEGVKLAEADVAVTSADLPNGKATANAQKQSTRGG